MDCCCFFNHSKLFNTVYLCHSNKVYPFDQAMLLVSRVTVSVCSSLLCPKGDTTALWDRFSHLFYGPLFFYPLLFLPLSLVSCLFFFHCKVKPISNSACLTPPVPVFQHTKPSENQSEKKMRCCAWQPEGVSHNEHQFSHQDEFIKFLSGAKFTSQQINDAQRITI